MSDEGVCRTAPATPGLFKSCVRLYTFISNKGCSSGARKGFLQRTDLDSSTLHHSPKSFFSEACYNKVYTFKEPKKLYINFS